MDATSKRKPVLISDHFLLVGDLRRAIEGLPDDSPVEVEVQGRPASGFELRPSGVDLLLSVDHLGTGRS